jgi:uncharacterized membrane protein
MRYGFTYGPNMMGGYSPIWMGLFATLFWLVIVVGVVILVIAVSRQSRHEHHMAQPYGGPVAPAPQVGPPVGPQQHDEAMAIARKRLASGEITREQFEDIRQALGG